MAISILEAIAIVNIELVKIVTIEDTPVTHYFKTAKEASMQPYISEGQEEILRKLDTILALSRTEDIQIGTDVTLKHAALVAEILALVDGGTYDDVAGTYAAPVAGAAVSRTPFTLTVYTADKDVDGAISNYVSFEFPNCKGTPVSYEVKDGEFIVPEMVIKSRPASGVSPVSINFEDTYPTV